MSTITLKLHEHLAWKLEQLRERLEQEIQRSVSSSFHMSTSQALNTLLENILSEEGQPLFVLGRDPVIRALRRRIHEGARSSSLSFRPAGDALSRLDLFVYWLSSLSVVESRIDRAAAIRTILLEGLDHEGNYRFSPEIMVSWGNEGSLHRVNPNASKKVSPHHLDFPVGNSSDCIDLNLIELEAARRLGCDPCKTKEE